MIDANQHSDMQPNGKASAGDEPRLSALGEPAEGSASVAPASAERADASALASVKGAGAVASASAESAGESPEVAVPASAEAPARSANAVEGYRAVADEHVQTLKSFWKNFLVSGLFVVAAIVIILACLAWFLNNSQVKASGASVSAAGLRYTITAEGDKLGAYDSRVSGKLDTSDSMSVSATSNLKNYDGSAQLTPGSYGTLTFTVTPYADDVHDITVDLDRCFVTRTNDVYPAANAESTKELEPLRKLLAGHIVFFENNSNDVYEKPILDGELTISEDSFEGAKRTAVKKTIYWIWPEHFRDFVLTGGVNYEKNLFATTAAEGYSALLEDINGNDSWSKYFYPSRPTNALNNPIVIEQGMSTADLQTCSDAYDAADEAIGGNVRYIQIRLTANEAEAKND